MLLLSLLLACGPYTVEDWWLDQADAFCTCNFPETYDSCFDQQMSSYQQSVFWDACYDDPAPVEETEVRDWYRDYTENCAPPALEKPSPDDVNWFEDCAG